MTASPDFQPMPPQLIEKVTDRLDELARQAVASALKAEADKQALLDHLRNLHGQELTVTGRAMQYNGGDGFKPSRGDDPVNKGTELAPGSYEIGEVGDWGEFGSQVTLRTGDMAFTVTPTTLRKATPEDVNNYRAALDRLPEMKDLDD